MPAQRRSRCYRADDETSFYLLILHTPIHVIIPARSTLVEIHSPTFFYVDYMYQYLWTFFFISLPSGWGKIALFG